MYLTEFPSFCSQPSLRPCTYSCRKPTFGTRETGDDMISMELSVCKMRSQVS